MLQNTDLAAVGAFCIGTNQIDLAAAASRGVAAFNAPYSNTRSVVELVIGEIIALARRLTEKTSKMHDGVWDKSAQGSHEVRGRTLGIVGYGNIGTQLSNLAESMGLRVIFFDSADRLAHGNARRVGTLDELLEQADVVSLHVDGRPGNAGLFGAAQFAKMKPRSLFINASRGMVVDDVALREHILSGHIAGAALDVFPVEPKAQGDPFESALRGLPNVILTPHVGGSTQEAQEEIGFFVSGKLSRYHLGGSTELSVNLPEVAAARAHGGLPDRAAARQRARRARLGQPAPRRAGGQRLRAVPLHPRRAGVRRHRRRRAAARGRARRAPDRRPDDLAAHLLRLSGPAQPANRWAASRSWRRAGRQPVGAARARAPQADRGRRRRGVRRTAPVGARATEPRRDGAVAQVRRDRVVHARHAGERARVRRTPDPGDQ